MILGSLRDFQRTFKIATILVAIFFSNAGQTKPSRSKENAQDIIEKAQTLVLQKDRRQAILLLSGAIERELKSGSSTKNMLQALQEISSTFLSEKAQQIFELAISLKSSDMKLSMQKINESLQMEPGNELIVVEKCRMLIALGNCSDCFNLAKSAVANNPYFEPLLLVGRQAEVCEKKPNQVFRPIPKSNKFELHWIIAEVESRMNTPSPAQIEMLLNKAAAIDRQFPETAYWKWKLLGPSNKKDEINNAGLKYLSLCRSISNRQQRNYSVDPMLCKRVSEVETFLKKNHNL